MSLLFSTRSPSELIPEVASSWSVTSAITTSMRTWASRTSSLSTRVVTNLISFGVPATTMALERSSETMVSRLENSSDAAALATRPAAALAAGVAGAPSPPVEGGGVGLSRVLLRRPEEPASRWVAVF